MTSVGDRMSQNALGHADLADVVSETSEIIQQDRTERAFKIIPSVENAFQHRIPTVLENRAGHGSNRDVRFAPTSGASAWLVTATPGQSPGYSITSLARGPAWVSAHFNFGFNHFVTFV
jgi:hypothetical protein